MPKSYRSKGQPRSAKNECPIRADFENSQNHLIWRPSSWSCIVSNPFINALSVCLVPLAGITEENSTVQRDILSFRIFLLLNGDSFGF